MGDINLSRITIKNRIKFRNRAKLNLINKHTCLLDQIKVSRARLAQATKRN